MQIKILEQIGQSALVEWQDAIGPHRAFIPVNRATGDVPSAVLDAGIIYGVPWERIIVLTVTPQQIARLLRERGIWTEEDLQRDVRGAQAALNEAYAIDFKNLLDAVRQVSAEAEN